MFNVSNLGEFIGESSLARDSRSNFHVSNFTNGLINDFAAIKRWPAQTIIHVLQLSRDLVSAVTARVLENHRLIRVGTETA